MDTPGLQWWVSTTTTSGRERQLLLENYPALMQRQWLPPEEEWPELRELRAEHERLLDVCDEALAAAVTTNAKFRGEDEKQEAETAAAIREGRKEETLKATPPEARRERQHGNIRRIEAAAWVLVEFLDNAFREIQQRAPDLYAQLEADAARADAKREEARRLLAEAEHVVAGVQRKRFWLDRESGRNQMPHYPFEQIAVPEPEEPVELLAALAGGAATTVEHIGG